MPWKEIVAVIRDAIASVEGIGQVHERPRHVITPEGFRALFKDEAKGINAWEIHRAGVGGEVIDFDVQEVTTHEFVVLGRMSHVDEKNTYAVFNDLVDAVMVSLRFNRELVDESGKATSYTTTKLIATDMGTRGARGRPLTHYVILSITVTERNVSLEDPGEPDEAVEWKQIKDVIQTCLESLEDPPEIVSRGRNFPARRATRAAFLESMGRQSLREPSSATLFGYVVKIHLSCDALDTPGAGAQATGEHAKRIVEKWLDALWNDAAGLHMKTASDFPSIDGLNLVSLDDDDRDRLRSDRQGDVAVLRARIEAEVTATFELWRCKT